MKRQLVFADWLVENPPPSLQALVERWGDYRDIPEHAWLQFYRDAEEWRGRLGQRERGDANV